MREGNGLTCLKRLKIKACASEDMFHVDYKGVYCNVGVYQSGVYRSSNILVTVYTIEVSHPLPTLG